MDAVSPSPDADAVGRAVEIFLGRLVADPTLAIHFVGIDEDRVLRHARAFVIAALGGPDLYRGRDMHAVHLPFALTDRNFDTAVDYLIDSLREVGVSEGVITGLAARLEPLRRQIVTA